MFSNGTEYGEFLKRECSTCPFYARWDDETNNKPLCQIEERMAWAMYTGNRSEDFPYEWLNLEWSQEKKEFFYSCKKKDQTLEEIA